jgi:hypothetical protein
MSIISALNLRFDQPASGNLSLEDPSFGWDSLLLLFVALIRSVSIIPRFDENMINSYRLNNATSGIKESRYHVEQSEWQFSHHSS